MKNPRPLLYGGGQESGLRPGTEPVAQMAGFAEAVRRQKATMAEDTAHMAACRDYVLAQTAEGFGVVGADVGRAAILGQMTVGFPISPLTASTFLLVGLAGVAFGEHQKKTIPLAWLVSIVMVVVAVIIGGIAL